MVLLFADKEEESVVFLTTFLVVAFEFLPVLDKEKEEEEEKDDDDDDACVAFDVCPCDAFEKMRLSLVSGLKIHKTKKKQKKKCQKFYIDHKKCQNTKQEAT